MLVFLTIITYACIVMPQYAYGQSFLRDGFNARSGLEFEGSGSVETDLRVPGMSTEMIYLKESKALWELKPPIITNDELDPALKDHIMQYCKHPILLRLTSKKGKHGMRAAGQLLGGQQLRAYWRMGKRPLEINVLNDPYDYAIKSRMPTIEFELQLPPLKQTTKQSRSSPKARIQRPGLPSIVYQVSLEQGGMNTQAYTPSTSGTLQVLPMGHPTSADDRETPIIEQAGLCRVGISMRNGLVDPLWARGRTVFHRKYRSAGSM